MQDTVHVPVTPSEAMWDGLARAIMMWLDFGPGSKTPRALFKHLEASGRDIPDWLRNEDEMKALDHVPSKGTRCAIIYRAMIEDHLANVHLQQEREILPLDTESVPLSTISSFLVENARGAWTWVKNTRCKYLTIHVDVRNGATIRDRDNNPISEYELLWQYSKDTTSHKFDTEYDNG